MMAVLRILLPILFLGFFLVQARKSRIFLLGLPFLMYMRESVFFEMMLPFWMPQRLGYGAMILFWLFVVWLIASDVLLRSGRYAQRRRPLGPAPSLPEEGALAVAAALVIVAVSVTAVNEGDLVSALRQASDFGMVLVGYVLVRGIVSQASRAEVDRLLVALVAVNTIAAGLFILHQGFNLPIYAEAPHTATYYEGTLITRGFSYAPQLLELALPVVLARRVIDVKGLAIALTTLAAAWVTFTRSVLLTIVVEVVVLLGVRFIKRNQAALFIRRAIGIALTIAIVGVMATLFMPDQSRYFLSRIVAATPGRHLIREPSFETRMSYVARTYRFAEDGDLLLGAGFVSPQQEPRSALVDRWAADTAVVPILYRLGVLGLAAFSAVFLTYGWRALRLSLIPDEHVEYQGMVWLSVVVAMVVAGLSSWVFLDPDRLPLGLWPLAFLAAEAARVRDERAAAVAKNAWSPGSSREWRRA